MKPIPTLTPREAPLPDDLLMESGDTSTDAPPARSQAHVVIHAPIERVWHWLTAVAQWPRWNPAIQSATPQGPLASGARFVWKSQGFTVVSTLQDVQPLRRLSWTGAAFGTRAFHVWTLEPTPDGVVVRTAESFDGWLPRLMKRSMQKKLDATLPAWLASLKRVAEGGEAPVA